MTRRSLFALGFLATGLICLPLVACVYKPDVQQGNIITNADVSSIQRGMTADQIRFKLGDPVLTNIYADNRMVYVYTFQHGHHKMQSKRLIISLRNSRVVDYWYDSQPANAPVMLPSPN